MRGDIADDPMRTRTSLSARGRHATHGLKLGPWGPSMRLRRLLFSAMIMIALAPVASYCQTIEVSGSSGQISEGGDAYINPNNSPDWPMPELNISFSGLSSCDSISLSITMSFVDPFTNYVTHYDTGSHTMQGGDTWALGWSFGPLLSEGGSADLFYQINNGPAQSFTFNILGENAAKTSVDQYYATQNPPWFWGNMLAVESGGSQFNGSGNPFVVGNPDGIGISQIDGVENPPEDCDYWNYQCNITNGLAILKGNQPNAYTFWNKQVAQSAETPVPTNLNTACNGSYFSYPQTGSWNFEDAEWIQAYNGTTPLGAYFISWGGTNYPNQWHINYPWTDPSTGITYDYVHQVCVASRY